MNIDKGVIKSFALLVAIVALIGAVFIASYVWAIVGGSVAYMATNGTTTTLTVITEEGFVASNVTAQSLDHSPIISETLSIYNTSNNFVWGLSNFTINYSAGTVLTIDNETISTHTPLKANYTYSTTTGQALPVSSATQTFFGTAETSFFTNLGYVQTAAGIGGGLIAVAIILLIFASFIKTGKDVYGPKKRKSSRDLSY